MEREGKREAWDQERFPGAGTSQTDVIRVHDAAVPCYIMSKFEAVLKLLKLSGKDVTKELRNGKILQSVAKRSYRRDFISCSYRNKHGKTQPGDRSSQASER